MGLTYLKQPRRAATLALACSAVFGVLMHSGAAQAMSLMQAYEAALKNDPDYRAATFDNESGKEYAVLGRAGLLPQLSASYAGSKNRADIDALSFGRSNTTHPVYNSRSANLSLHQAIINLDALARYRQGQAQTASSAAQFSGRGQELILRLVGSYIDVLAADESMRLAQLQRDTYREQSHVNARLFDKGEGTKTDMLETQSRLELAEAQLLEAQDTQSNMRTVLAGIVGADISNLDGLAGDFHTQPLEPARFEQWKALALTENAELRTRTLALEAARQEINKARAGHAPRLDFVANYSKTGSETINTLDQNATTRSIGLQLNVPLYSGGYVNATSRQAVAGYEKAKADLQGATDKTLADLRKQYSLAVSSAFRIDALVKAVSSATLLVSATEQSIKGGVRINLDLLNAQQQLFSSQRDLAQTRYNYLMATLRLRSAAGTLNLDDVRALARYFR